LGGLDTLLQGAVPESKVDPALTAEQAPRRRRARLTIFSIIFFFETRTAYVRENTDFYRSADRHRCNKCCPRPDFNPNGIPYPGAFQPSANSLDSFIDFGTRGWISDRCGYSLLFSATVQN